MSICRTSCSVISVIPIFINGGINLALSLGWNSYAIINSTLQFKLSWFIGICVGAICAAPLVLRTSNRFLMYVSAFFTFIAGLLCTSLPYSYEFVLASRYINGFSLGVATLSYLCSVSEIPPPKYRGIWMSFESICVSIGIFASIACQVYWTYKITFPINLAYGLANILFALVALLATSFYVESPLYYMRRQDFITAAELLNTTDNANVDTATLLAHNKQYIEQHEHKNFGELAAESWLPLLKLVCYRATIALTFSLPLNYNLKISGFKLAGKKNIFVCLLYGGMRCVGAFLGMFIYDTFGRKFISMVALTAMSALTLGIGIVFYKEINNYNDVHLMKLVCTMAVVFQLFSGFYAPTTSIYLSEAFPMTLKPYLIATCIVVEQLVHIIVLLTYYNDAHNMAVFSVTSACIIAFVFVILSLTMPETKATTLLKAQKNFQSWFSIKLC